MLFFGVLQRIFTTYPLHTLYIEVWDKARMEKRIQRNNERILLPKWDIKIVEIKQHKRKILTHILNFIGMGKYRKMFKFFWGGEVLSDERPFPHDGRNIPLLFHYAVRTKKFALLWGIGTARKTMTHRLYSTIIPRAQHIILRDKSSYDTACTFTKNKEAIELYQDFAQETILQVSEKSDEVSEKSEKKYILINMKNSEMKEKNIHKIQQFCKKYADYEKIFFPCDMQDDAKCFEHIQKIAPELQMFDRTQYSLSEILSLFYHSTWGIGCRLHFLLPLKLYTKDFEAIPYAEKISKLILN